MGLAVGFGSSSLSWGARCFPRATSPAIMRFLKDFVIYSGVWLSLLAFRGAVKLSRPLELRSVTRERVIDVGLISVFGVVIALLCHSSLMNGEQSGIFASYSLARNSRTSR